MPKMYSRKKRNKAIDVEANGRKAVWRSREVLDHLGISRAKLSRRISLLRVHVLRFNLGFEHYQHGLTDYQVWCLEQIERVARTYRSHGDRPTKKRLVHFLENEGLSYDDYKTTAT